MSHDPDFILSVLDKCCATFTFPMLDNGYVYLAASRLSVHFSPEDWALVIEIFGYSPRSWVPDLHVHTFASRLHNRRPPDAYSPERRANYLATFPNSESAFFFPIAEGAWMDEQAGETVSATGFVELRVSACPFRL